MNLAKKVARRVSRSLDVLIHGKEFQSNLDDISSITTNERKILEAIRIGAYWASLAGKYRGCPGFVVGNGPSLTIDDLTRIFGQVSIASNKIYLAFDETPWRPNIYTVADPLVWGKIKDIVLDLVPTVHIPDYLDCGSSPRVIPWRFLGNNEIDAGQSPRFSDNLPLGLYGGNTVTYDNIQIAVFLGLNPIYLIGCDHYYAGEDDKFSPGERTHASARNHFHPDYRKPGEIVNAASIPNMNMAYEAASLYCRANKIEIYNATRGGCLDVFERRDLDQVFDQISGDSIRQE